MSSKIFQSHPVESASSSVSLTLGCLIKGDSVTFEVDVNANHHVCHLREVIYGKRTRGMFHDVDATDLTQRHIMRQPMTECYEHCDKQLEDMFVHAKFASDTFQMSI